MCATHRRMSPRAVSLLSCALVVVSSCTDRTGTTDIPDVGPIDAHVAGDAAVDSGHDAGAPIDGGPDLSSVLIFAHSRNTLYSFSPFTNTVEEIGTFTLPGGESAPEMTDLAVNADNEIYTVSNDELFRVDPITAESTRIGALTLGSDQVFALTFLVPGELGPGETLVGATNEGVVYRIDPMNAACTRVGQYPDGWQSSGDLVSVQGLGTFATIRGNEATSDLLAFVRFTDAGIVLSRRGDGTGYMRLFGLGYWGSKLYGFSGGGELIEIDRDTGTGTIATADTGTSQFWGAGVTTRVPVIF